MSLPNILFGVEDEEAEKLVEERPSFKSDDKKEKKKWYNRLPNPGNLLSPLRRSFTKLKRKHDHYETTEDSSEVPSEISDVSTDVNGNAETNDQHEQFNYLSEKKLSVSDDDIPYFIDEKVSPNQPGIESVSKFIDADVSKGHVSVKEHFGEARALVHGRVTVTDILSGRYRKL